MYIHQPVCAVAQKLGKDGTEEEMVFLGENCQQDFCEWLFQPCHNGYLVMAHNARGFDSQFVLNYLHKQSIKPEVILRGTQIMMLQVEKIRILDSMNFLPMKLAALPKAFNLTELKKGYYPYMFWPEEGFDYEGEWPAAKYYNIDAMFDNDYDAFNEWYVQQVGKVFKLRDEMIAYCKSDVDILKHSVLKFRDLFTGITGMSPYTSITIASA